jgi:hypothetical protein
MFLKVHQIEWWIKKHYEPHVTNDYTWKKKHHIENES